MYRWIAAGWKVASSGHRTHDAPWDERVRRVVVVTSQFRNLDGSASVGGRERYIRDLAAVVRHRWNRDVVVLQKGDRDFDVVEPGGLQVRGFACHPGKRGNAALGARVQGELQPSDGVIHANGEGCWPFFATDGKGLQHGVYWDGPYPRYKQVLNARRNLDFVRAMRSVLCVDTAYIDWLRGRGRTGLRLSEKCVYVPNYADLDALGPIDADRPPHTPLRLLFARRFQPKRGPVLFIDALAELRRRGVAFEATVFSVGGHAELADAVARRGLGGEVHLRRADLDQILAQYAAHDVAVVPSVWSEGTSFACVEAICAGLPVVVTPVGGLGNLVVPGFNGAVAPPRPDALANAIASIADETTWRRMRANCLAMRPALSKARWEAELLAWLRR